MQLRPEFSSFQQILLHHAINDGSRQLWVGIRISESDGKVAGVLNNREPTLDPVHGRTRLHGFVQPFVRIGTAAPARRKGWPIGKETGYFLWQPGDGRSDDTPIRLCLGSVHGISGELGDVVEPQGIDDRRYSGTRG